MKVWLDDVRPMPFDYDVHFVNGESLLDYIDSHLARGEGVPITHISFDHDLGLGKLTGYEVAVYLERLSYFGHINRISWAVHSANPVGRDNIRRAMRSCERWWARYIDKEA